MNAKEFTVNQNGTGAISQRGLARLCGVDEKTIRKWRKAYETAHAADVVDYNTNDNNELVADSDGFLSEDLCVYALTKAVEMTRPQAIKTLMMVMKAGVRAYIYQQSGVVFLPATADQPANLMLKPIIPLEWLAKELRRPTRSLHITFKRTLERLPETSLLCNMIKQADDWYLSPAFIICSDLVGKNVAAVKERVLAVGQGHLQISNTRPD